MQGESYNQASNSYAIAIANNGYTLRPRDLTTPTQGFVVGIHDYQPQLIKQEDFTLEMFVKSFNDVARDIVNNNCGTLLTNYQYPNGELINVSTDLCVGGWLHEGYWYVESTQVVADKRDAIYLGKHNQQKAIWDLEAKQEIIL